MFNISTTAKRTGTLWEDRYKTTLIDSDQYLLTCMRYIELNPVRADMVGHPADYPWLNYHSNAVGEEDDLLTPHLFINDLARMLSNNKRLTGNYSVHKYQNQILNLSGRRQIRHGFLEMIVSKKIQKLTNRQVTPKATGRPCISPD